MEMSSRPVPPNDTKPKVYHIWYLSSYYHFNCVLFFLRWRGRAQLAYEHFFFYIFLRGWIVQHGHWNLSCLQNYVITWPQVKGNNKMKIIQLSTPPLGPLKGQCNFYNYFSSSKNNLLVFLYVMRFCKFVFLVVLTIR